VLAGGSVGSSQATQNGVLSLLVERVVALDGLSSEVDVLSDVASGDENAGLGLGGSGLLGTVGQLVLGNEGEGSLEFLFGVLFRAVNADGAGSVASVVETSDGEGVGGPVVAVELDEVSIVSSGEGPNNAVGDLHFYKREKVNTLVNESGQHKIKISSPFHLPLIA